jgi:hypothetical protein
MIGIRTGLHENDQPFKLEYWSCLAFRCRQAGPVTGRFPGREQDPSGSEEKIFGHGLRNPI